jgi:hypothetical protein
MNRPCDRLPNRSRRWAPTALGIAALQAIAVLLVMAPGAFALEAVRTNPAHRGRAPVWPLDVPQVVPPTVYESGGYLVIKTDRKLAEVAALEPRLTDLCRFGLFHQSRDGWFFATFGDRTFGVGFGHGLGLVDAISAADRSRVYVFLHPGSSACEVRSVPNPDQRYAKAGG